jgi:hypothetical protein
MGEQLEVLERSGSSGDHDQGSFTLELGRHETPKNSIPTSINANRKTRIALSDYSCGDESKSGLERTV